MHAGSGSRAHYPPLDLSKPVEVAASRKDEYCTLYLGKDSLEARLPGRKFVFAPQSIEAFRVSAKAQHVRYTIEILGKTKVRQASSC